MILSGSDVDLALVLSGGNALGAYQAGAYQLLHERGLEPDWVAGASIGAINGAVICGNPAEQRIARLNELWSPAPDTRPDALEETRRTGAAAWTLATGKPGMFVPRNLFGPWWNPFGDHAAASLYDAAPLTASLERLVDFDRLNRGSPRYSATAVDVETGDDVIFDTRTHRIDPLHLRASSALLPAFQPIEVGGRLLCDAGLSANLPLDSVLGAFPERPLLCIVLDLLPLRGTRPETLGDAVVRAQDLIFATQSRRAIAAWQGLYDERTRHGATMSVTVLHIAYADQAREVSGKAFDFSPESVALRWAAGRDDLTRTLDALAADGAAIGHPGLHVHTRIGPNPLAPIRWPMTPIAATPPYR